MFDEVNEGQSENAPKGETQSNSHKRVWALQVCKDIWDNYSKISMIVIVMASLVLTFVWREVEYNELQKKCLCGDLLTMFSCVFGFVAVGFSIILTLNQDTIKKLKKSSPKSSEKRQKCCMLSRLILDSPPYSILCASFSFSCIFLLLTMALAILYKNMPNAALTCDWLFIIIQFLSISTTLIVVDLVFHLYSVSTYIYKNNENE